MTKHNDSTSDTVLVPPDAVHTPGTTLHADKVQRVAVPVDAEADPDAARAAYLKAQAGDTVEVDLTDDANAEQATNGPESDAGARTGTGAATGTGTGGRSATAAR